MFLPDLSGLIRGTRNLISVFDASDRIVYANAAFREAYHLGTDDYPTWVELMRHGWATRTGTEITSCNGDFENWLSSALSRRGKLAFRSFQTSLYDGRWLWVTETVDERGWMLYIGVDITPLNSDDRDLRTAHDVALKAAQTDELTGISNRRYMMQRLHELIDSGTPGCIAMLDLDHFKSINDRYGHEAGDTVLVDFARRVGHTVRRGDEFGRIGGEEFLFLLPDTRIDDAVRLLDRIRDQIRAASPLPHIQAFHYTVSIGVTAIVPDDRAQTLLSRADQACYDAKNQGRDRTVSL